MRRTTTILGLLALGSLLMGSGENPPPGGAQKVTGPAVSAVVVIDPHNGTLTGGQASIRLTKGTQTSGANFVSLKALGWTTGCNASNVVAQTENRFLYSDAADNRLTGWIPSSTDTTGQGDVLRQLFLGVGINLSVADESRAVITSIDNAVCTTDPTGEGGTNPGFLSFQAVIQFIK